MNEKLQLAIMAVAAKMGLARENLRAEARSESVNLWQVTDTNTGEIYLYGARSGMVQSARTIQIKSHGK